VDAMTTVITREATVDIVRRKFPSGTRLVNKNSRAIYIIGVKHGISNFWMMKLEPPNKGIMSATQILDQFERENAGI
jgi:hypothetical protein